MYYDQKKIEWLKERYPEGTRICLDQMNDDPFPVESGTFGKVDHICKRSLIELRSRFDLKRLTDQTH